MRGRLAFVLIAAGAGMTMPAGAAANNPFGVGDPYRACVAAIGLGAEDALEKALMWRDQGGGAPAEHCAALALIALDDPGLAASRLDALARRPDVPNIGERAMILAQSGNAWLLANQPETAEAAFSAALKLRPRDADIWTDRARARALRKDWAGAESDLTNALTFEKTHADIFVLRAMARKSQGDMKGYKADIEAALALDPTYPDALVERGAIKLAAGDKNGARADWVQVLLRDPDGPAADTVRNHIQALEVHDTAP